MTSGGRSDWPAWLASLLGQNSGAHLVGHSIGASAALEAAVAHPDKVGLITLVAPFFLQPPAGLSTRATPLTRWYLRRVRADALSRRLTGVADHAEALESSVQDLRRGRVAANVATLLATAASERWRSQLRSTFARYPGPVQVIIGSEDPLANRAAALLDSLGPRVTLTTIPGAGHHPQLTHPDALSGAIGQHPLATPTPTKPHGRH
jgi:pimeloyl-ACP methyl ester carboxylesterase